MDTFTNDTFKEALLYVNSLLGAKIAFQEEGGWAFDEGRYLVSPSYYRKFGFTEEELRVMLLIDAWVLVYAPVKESERFKTRKTIAQREPKLIPVLQLTDRLEAIQDINRSFTGFRQHVKMSFLKFIGRDLRGMHPQTQVLTYCLVLVLGLSKNVRASTLALESFGDIERFETLLLAALKKDTARKPDSNLKPDTRLKRTVALILKPFMALEENVNIMRGLSDSGMADDEGATLDDSLDFGEPGMAAEDENDGEANKSEETSNERLSSQSEISEGADLFEASGAAPIDAFISSPLEAASRRASEFAIDQSVNIKEGARDVMAREGRTAGGGSVAEYLSLTGLLDAEISQMYEVWLQYLEEKSSLVRSFSRKAVSSGDRLDVAKLAGTLVQARSGVPEPEAFNMRERRLKPREDLIDTDYVLVLDRSASMGGAIKVAANSAIVLMESLNLVMAELADRALAADLPVGDINPVEIRTAVIVFDSDAHTVKPLSTGVNDAVRTKLLSRVKDVGGATNDALALLVASQVLSDGAQKNNRGRNRKKIVIVIGDGDSTDEDATLRQLQKLLGEGTEVWGIGVRAAMFKGQLGEYGTVIENESELMGEVLKIVRHSHRE